MNYRKPILLIILVIIGILVMGVVSAEDLNSQNNQTFQDIQTQIDNAENGTTITLDGYYYGNGTPISLINKKITFIGINNATLDAKGLSGIMNISSSNVVFENIIFINGNASNGGAIYAKSSSLFVNDSIFKTLFSFLKTFLEWIFYLSNICFPINRIIFIYSF